VIVTGIILLLCPLFERRMRWRLIRECPGRTGGEYTIVADEKSIREMSDAGEMVRPWTALTKVEETSDHVFLFTYPLNILVLPKRAFERPEDVSAVLDHARRGCAE
jgi:YcxB-like protein